MNKNDIFENFFNASLLIGAIIGAITGFANAGIGGAIAGIILGGIAGLIFLFLAIIIYYIVTAPLFILCVGGIIILGIIIMLINLFWNVGKP